MEFTVDALLVESEQGKGLRVIEERHGLKERLGDLRIDAIDEVLIVFRFESEVIFLHGFGAAETPEGVGDRLNEREFERSLGLGHGKDLARDVMTGRVAASDFFAFFGSGTGALFCVVSIGGELFFGNG